MSKKTHRGLTRREFAKITGAGALAAGVGAELPVPRPRGGAAEDAEDRPVEPLRARLRQVVRQHLHQGMGGEEQHQRRRGPHRHRRDQRPRRGGSRGQEGARPLHVPVAARGLREAGHRPRRDLRGGREEARQEDRPRAQVHVQPEDEEVLRLLGFLRPRPGQLPQGPLGEGRIPQRARHLGRPARRRQEDQGPVRQSRRHRALAGARHEHGHAGRALVLRRPASRTRTATSRSARRTRSRRSSTCAPCSRRG